MTTLAERIAARIDAAATHHERAGIGNPTAHRGLAVGGPDHPRIVLTIQDIAQIAALAVEESR